MKGLEPNANRLNQGYFTCGASCSPVPHTLTQGGKAAPSPLPPRALRSIPRPVAAPRARLRCGTFFIGAQNGFVKVIPFSTAVYRSTFLCLTPSSLYPEAQIWRGKSTRNPQVAGVGRNEQRQKNTPSGIPQDINPASSPDTYYPYGIQITHEAQQQQQQQQRGLRFFSFLFSLLLALCFFFFFSGKYFMGHPKNVEAHGARWRMANNNN